MRRRYYMMYYGNSNTQVQLSRNKEVSENEIVNKVINYLNTKYSERAVKNQNEILEILSEISKIKDESFLMDQAEKLLEVIYEKIDASKKEVAIDGKTGYILKRYKNFLIIKFTSEIDKIQAKTNNIEELRDLRQKLSKKIEEDCPAAVTTLKSKINGKILRLQTMISNNENNITKNIQAIARNISSSEPNEELIEHCVSEEEDRRLSISPKTKFSLTREQQREQIYFQVGQALKIQSRKYPIQNPEVAVDTLQRIFAKGLYNNVRAVVNNYVENKDYKSANALCEKYMQAVDKDAQKDIYRIKCDVQKAEIGSLVLRGLDVEATKEEQRNLYEIVEKISRCNEIPLNSISIGKSEDGLRNITLADILENDRNKGR